MKVCQKEFIETLNFCDYRYSCNTIQSFLELTNRMVKDIMGLLKENARYSGLLSEYVAYATEHGMPDAWETIENPDIPQYIGDAYRLYCNFYYAGGDPLAFRSFVSQISSLSQNGEDDTDHTTDNF